MMFDILIIRFFMFLQTLSLCCFIITSIAGITFTFMNDHLHLFQTTEFCCLTRTTITIMFLTCMKIFCKDPQRTQLGHSEMTTVASFNYVSEQLTVLNSYTHSLKIKLLYTFSNVFLINSVSNFMLFQKIFQQPVQQYYY